MSKILLIGDICAESQYFVDKVPVANELALINTTTHVIGSKVINAGRVLAKEHAVSMFGVVGDDKKGQEAIEGLKKSAIDTQLIYPVDAPTDEVLVLTDNSGGSAIALYQDATAHLDQTRISSLPDYEWIYTATSIPLLQLYEIIERANKEGVGIFLDIPNKHGQLDLEKLKTVDFIVPNKIEAGLILKRELSSISDALEAAITLKKTARNVIITLDKDGCVVFAEGWDKPKHFPAIEASPVDTTAAGDIFRGAFLREYLKTKDITASIDKALYLSAESVKIRGVEQSIEYVNSL